MSRQGVIVPFDFSDAPVLKNLTRENRKVQLVDKKKKYEGQWLIKTEERDG